MVFQLSSHPASFKGFFFATSLYIDISIEFNGRSVEYESNVPEYSSVRFSVPGCTCCLSGFLTPFWSSHLRRFPYMTSFCPTPPAGLLSDLSTAAYITEGWLSGSAISTVKGLTFVWIFQAFLFIYMHITEKATRTVS